MLCKTIDVIFRQPLHVAAYFFQYSERFSPLPSLVTGIYDCGVCITQGCLSFDAGSSGYKLNFGLEGFTIAVGRGDSTSAIDPKDKNFRRLSQLQLLAQRWLPLQDANLHHMDAQEKLDPAKASKYRGSVLRRHSSLLGSLSVDGRRDDLQNHNVIDQLPNAVARSLAEISDNHSEVTQQRPSEYMSLDPSTPQARHYPLANSILSNALLHDEHVSIPIKGPVYVSPSGLTQEGSDTRRNPAKIEGSKTLIINLWCCITSVIPGTQKLGLCIHALCRFYNINSPTVGSKRPTEANLHVVILHFEKAPNHLRINLGRYMEKGAYRDCSNYI